MTKTDYATGDVSGCGREFESGWTEIAFYTPEIVSGAGPVLRSTARGMTGGGEWSVSTSRILGALTATKAEAITLASAHAQADHNAQRVTFRHVLAA